MTEQKVPSRIFPRAKEDAESAERVSSSPQTVSRAYKLAFQDTDFLLREDLRPIRFQLELLKPELLLEEAGIASTFVFYGSARIPAPDKADALVDAAKTDTQRAIANRLKANSKYYDEARKLARLASATPKSSDGKKHFVVCSGGGPSIMEAANRGAADEGQAPAARPHGVGHPLAHGPACLPARDLANHTAARNVRRIPDCCLTSIQHHAPDSTRWGRTKYPGQGT